MSVDNKQMSQATEIHQDDNKVNTQNIKDQHEYDKQNKIVSSDSSTESKHEQTKEETKTQLNDQRNGQINADNQIEEKEDKSKLVKEDNNQSLQKDNKKIISPQEKQHINNGDQVDSSQKDKQKADSDENNGSRLSEQHDKTKIINEIHLDEEILVKSKEKQKEGIQHENEVTGEKEGNKKDDKNGKQSNKLGQMIEILQGQQNNGNKEIVEKTDTNNNNNNIILPQHGQDNDHDKQRQTPLSVVENEKSGKISEQSEFQENQENSKNVQISAKIKDNQNDEQSEEEDQQEMSDDSVDNKQDQLNPKHQDPSENNDQKHFTETSNDEYVSHVDHQKSIQSLKKVLEMEKQSSSQYLKSSQKKNTEDQEDQNSKKMSDIDANEENDEERKLAEELLSISTENKELKENNNSNSRLSNEGQQQQSSAKSSDSISCSPNLKHSNITALTPLQIMERRERNLHTVYKFYCKQSYVSGKYATFDRVLQETNIMSMGKFFLFIRDFQIVTRGIKKYKLVEMFKKTSSNSKELSFPEFLIVLDRMAQLFPVEISSKADGSVVDKKEEFYQFLSLDDQAKLKEKVKNVNLPFHTHAKPEHISGKDFPKLKPIKLTERDISLLSPIRNVKDKSLLHKDSAISNHDNAKANILSNIESVSESSVAPSVSAKQSPSPQRQPSSTKKPPLGISPSVNHKKQPKKLSQKSSIEEVMKSCTWEKLLSSSISDLKQLIDDDFNPEDLLDASNEEDDEYLEEYNSPTKGNNQNNNNKKQLDKLLNDQSQIKQNSTEQDDDYEQEQWRVRSQRRKQRPSGQGLGIILNERGKSLPQQQIILQKQLSQQEDYASRNMILDYTGNNNNNQQERKSSKSLHHRRDSSPKKQDPTQYYSQLEDLGQQQISSRHNSAINKKQQQPSQQQLSLNVLNKKLISKSDTKDNSRKHPNSKNYQPEQNYSQGIADIQMNNNIPQVHVNQGIPHSYKSNITRVKRSISDAPNQQDNYYNNNEFNPGNININDQGYNVQVSTQAYVPQSYQKQQLNNILLYNQQSSQKNNRSNIVIQPQNNYGVQSQNKSCSHIPQKQYQEGQNNISIYDQAPKGGYMIQGSESNSNMPTIVRRQKSTLIAEKDGINRRLKGRSVDERAEDNQKREMYNQENQQAYTDRRSESINKGQQNYLYKNYQNTNESKVSFASKIQGNRHNQLNNGNNMNSNTNISNNGLNDSFSDQNNINNRMINNNYNIQLDTKISSNNEINNKNRSLMLAANDVMNSNIAYSLTERQRQMVEDQRKRIAQVGVTSTQKSSKDAKIVAQLLQNLRNKGKKMPAPNQERSYLFQE